MSSSWNYQTASTWSSTYPQCSLSNSVQSPIHLSAVPMNPMLSVPTFTASQNGCTSWTQGVSTAYFYVDFTQSGATCTNNYMTWSGTNYVLQKIVFHSPAEHTIGGGYFDGEVQFRHQSTSGVNAYVSVLLSVDPFLKTANNTFLNRLWNGYGIAKLVKTQTIVSSTTNDMDPYQDFFPARQAHYQYQGSSTEPPCSAKVNWFVFDEPVQISLSDFNLIRGLPAAVSKNILANNGNNNRPEQHNTLSFTLSYTEGASTAATATPSQSTWTSISSYTTTNNASSLILGSFALIFGVIGLCVSLYMYYWVFRPSYKQGGVARGGAEFNPLQQHA